MRHQSSTTSLPRIPSQTLDGVLAAVEADQFDRTALLELSKGHRRTRPDRS